MIMTPLTNYLQETDKKFDNLTDKCFSIRKVKYYTWEAKDKALKSFLHYCIKEAYELGKKEDIKLSEEIELQNETEFNEWRAFKQFRNTLTDKLQHLTNKDGK